MATKGQEKAIKEFWQWFMTNKSDLLFLSETRDPTWDVMLGKLRGIAPGLWFELSDLDVAPREFIITAEGRVELFPLVEEIVERAPDDSDWKFIALKPPMGFGFKTTYEGIQVDPKSLWFLPLKAAPTHLLSGCASECRATTRKMNDRPTTQQYWQFSTPPLEKERLLPTYNMSKSVGFLNHQRRRAISN